MQFKLLALFFSFYTGQDTMLVQNMLWPRVCLTVHHKPAFLKMGECIIVQLMPHDSLVF